MSTPLPVVRIEMPMQGCALVTLDRQQAKNAMSLEMRRKLVHLFTTELHAVARVVVLTGAGSAFCAGLDLKELAQAQDPRAFLAGRDLDVAWAIRGFPGPVIGAVNGVAITGGFELALACDMLVASEAARFADTHARVGVLPAWGLSQVLARRIGQCRAKQLSFTGNFLGAQRALDWGLVNEVVAAAELTPAALRLAEAMLSAEPESLVAYKSLIDAGSQLPLGEAMQLEQDRANAWAERLSAAALAGRRQDVLSRGRSQLNDGPA